MSCYGLTARTLADMVCKRLQTYQNHTGTKFMFNTTSMIGLPEKYTNLTASCTSLTYNYLTRMLFS